MSFILDSEVNTIFDVPVSKGRLVEFLSDPRSYELYMPGVESVRLVRTLGTGKLLYQWELVIQMPLVDPIRLSMSAEYVRYDDPERGHVINYCTTDESIGNRMNCNLEFVETGEETTDVRMDLRIVIHRASGEELHPLAPIIGQQIIQSQMKLKMQSIAANFLQKSVDAIYGVDLDHSPAEVV
ncbi:MAG: SRPBCC family protein [Chlorobiales bacterium]|jgi:hypothetical protein|nr:SRPBCC family protein [Chlorobiales bacterium]